MTKKDEVEELEGGDHSSDTDDLGFTPDIIGKAKKAADEDDTPAEDIEVPDEWEVASEDEANLDWTGKGAREDGSRVVKNYSTRGSGKEFISKKIIQFKDVYMKDMADYIESKGTA